VIPETRRGLAITNSPASVSSVPRSMTLNRE
jgi:hypothetical protein